MKSTEELELELLTYQRGVEGNQVRILTRQGISLAFKLTAINYIIFFVFLYGLNGLILNLHYFFFMESAFLFLLGGIVSTFKTSLSITSLANWLFGTSFRGDADSHVIGTQNVYSYSISAIILLLLSGLVYSTFLPFIDLVTPS